MSSKRPTPNSERRSQDMVYISGSGNRNALPNGYHADRHRKSAVFRQKWTL